MEIDFSDKTCEEASMFSVKTYIPCGKSASRIIYHERDGKHFYFMCDACASHNIANREAIELVTCQGCKAKLLA